MVGNDINEKDRLVLKMECSELTGIVSYWKAMLSEVFKCFILGPLLFRNLITDIAEHCCNKELFLYKDYGKIFQIFNQILSQ